jgi:hypothetical protein
MAGLGAVVAGAALTMPLSVAVIPDWLQRLAAHRKRRRLATTKKRT